MDNQSHQDNKTDISKTIEEDKSNDNNYYPVRDKCNICNKNNKNEQFVSMVHKWREYGGYSQNLYPRYFCSNECLEIFERDFRCNYCHIVTYDWNNYQKGPDGFTYCDNEMEITIGDKPCYYQRFNIT